MVVLVPRMKLTRHREGKQSNLIKYLHKDSRLIQTSERDHIYSPKILKQYMYKSSQL